MKPRSRPVVAIDGQAGAGKSTVTRRVAERLGYLLVDTGAIYRCVALAAERRGVAWDETDRVGAISTELAEKDAIRFEPGDAGAQRVVLEGDDVTTAIRTQSIGEGASRVSAIPAVRDALLEMQRKAGVPGGVVLEGRDIGTVVFPDAEAKFFLTASVEVRAERRRKELAERGQSVDIESVRREVAERDRRDSSRPVAPLRQAPDAMLVDSSNLGIDQVVDVIVAEVRRIEARLGGGAE